MKAYSRTALAILLVLTCSSANAFRTLTTEGYTDPDYKDYQVKKVVVLVENAPADERTQVEKRLSAEFGRRGIELVPYRSLFPPTRTWSPEQKLDILKRESVDSALVLTIGATASAVIPIATQSFGTATSSGSVFGTGNNNAAFAGSASSNSTSYNIYSAKSKAAFSAVLLDVSSARTVWYADITTKASGTAFVSSTGDIKALVKGVVDGLVKDNHVPKKYGD